MGKPLLFDYFCGAGGAGVGYANAGYEVVGIDIDPQPDYPFEFIRADAIAHMIEHQYDGVDVIHASPPCQRFTQGNAGSGAADKWPDLIGLVRDMLQAWGKPYVIENVPRSPLRDPLVLCGTMFNLTAIDDDGTLLKLKRHRHFESNVPLTPPVPCDHKAPGWWAGAYGGARRDRLEARYVRRGGYVPRSISVLQDLLGIEHMTREHDLFESIPPAYTEHIGRQLMEALS